MGGHGRSVAAERGGGRGRGGAHEGVGIVGGGLDLFQGAAGGGIERDHRGEEHGADHGIGVVAELEHVVAGLAGLGAEIGESGQGGDADGDAGGIEGLAQFGQGDRADRLEGFQRPVVASKRRGRDFFQLGEQHGDRGLADLREGVGVRGGGRLGF